MTPIKVLVIDDENLIRWSFQKNLKKQGYEVLTAETGREGIRLFESNFPDIVFIDNKLPDINGLEVITKILSVYDETNIVFMTAYGSIETAVKAMKLGACEYINKPFDFKEISNVMEAIRKKMELKREVKLLRRQQKENVTFDHIVGQSAEIKSVIQLAKKIAATDSTTVLLLGESGTGKDMFARAIHEESQRKGKQFVTINCSSLPESLLESELFGHEQGAFTDAKKLRKGLFEMADGGTVFLDEIGDITPPVQVKLLGVIENRTIRRVGGAHDIPVDIRIIAATNRDLAASVGERSFRQDLYYRLKVFQINVPALREHISDIPSLTEHFVHYFSLRFGKKLRKVDPAVIKLFLDYGWPGNIRELRNVIERAVILESGETLQTDCLPQEIAAKGETASQQPAMVERISENNIPADKIEDFNLYEIEKRTLIQALQKSGNNQSMAARILGITRDTMRYKMKKYGL